MKYTVCFLFNQDLSKCLFIEKNRGFEDHIGKFNGVGGKVDPEDQNEYYGAVREIKEETGVDTFGTLKFLLKCNFWEGTELSVYYDVVNQEEVKQIEDETLVWVTVKEILNEKVSSEQYAGMGSALFFAVKAYDEILKRR